MSNIFGRDAELASLRAAFNTSATRNKEGRYGGPQMVFIVAESGIGKSRLVQELYLQLASDKQWDPPESNYWPDAFGSIGDQILTNPNLDGHTPKGPPRFIWLGVRWTPVADRNPQLAQSILPDLLSKVNAHVNILERYGSVWSSAWSRALKKVHGDGINDVTDEIATKLIEITIQEIPFAGLVWKAAKGAKKLAEDRIEGIKSFDDIQREQAQSTAEEAVNVMRDLLHPKGAVPTILWFDDAQWIDDQTLQFLRNLWVEARKHGWPLFVVVTHWEREWRELER